jgi:23S rRNA (cytidine2498-2'-O)-methyltransferase
MKERVLIAPQGFEKDLVLEIQTRKQTQILGQWERLFWVKTEIEDWTWAQNHWLAPRLIEFASIKQAADQLKALNRCWSLHSVSHHRRAELILQQLPKIKTKPLDFLQKVNFPPLGAFALLEPGKLLASPSTLSPFPDGEMSFNEDKKNAPSRAYLKLWEFFTVTGLRPPKGALCIDMGSSPGGWTWVLSQMGCKVVSVDKAALDPRLSKSKLITALKKDAFTVDPNSVGPIEWFFSDIICYPEKLYKLVEKWGALPRPPQFVCTIKFKGETDFKTLELFRRIPGSKIRHLNHNKHEVTWYRVDQA